VDTNPHPVTGLEAWLVGTRADLRAAYRALAALGAVIEHGTPHPADRPDTGRYRVYVRLAVATQIAAPTPRRTKPAPPGSPPLPLAG
jgi:hypothetical protein